MIYKSGKYIFIAYLRQRLFFSNIESHLSTSGKRNEINQFVSKRELKIGEMVLSHFFQWVEVPEKYIYTFRKYSNYNNNKIFQLTFALKFSLFGTWVGQRQMCKRSKQLTFSPMFVSALNCFCLFLV